MNTATDKEWLAIKTKTETKKSEPTREAKSVEALQKDADNLLVTVTTNLQKSQSGDSLQCDGQTATCRSEGVNSVS